MNKNQILAKLGESGSYFLYDLDNLYSHAQMLNDGSSRLFFACKANPLSAILSTLNKAKIDFDVASEGELQQVLSLGIPGNRIIMTGPAKSKELLRLGLANKIATFVIESPSQLFQLQELAPDYGYKPNILFRLQLKWDKDGENILGGEQITPFGMDIETASLLLTEVKLPFLGFHIFQWGNILCLEKMAKIWEQTIKICRTIKSDFQVLDVGGGLGITYSEQTGIIEWRDVSRLIKELKAKYSLNQFWLEMGRYMTGQIGEYVTSVIDVKKTYDQRILVLEGGINHLARPALVNQYFPARLLRESNAELTKYALHGPLCTSLDFLGHHMLPRDIEIGDLIVFKQVGAYGFTESMPFFLCHKLPGEAIIRNNSVEIVREPQLASSWLK